MVYLKLLLCALWFLSNISELDEEIRVDLIDLTRQRLLLGGDEGGGGGGCRHQQN